MLLLYPLLWSINYLYEVYSSTHSVPITWGSAQYSFRALKTVRTRTCAKLKLLRICTRPALHKEITNKFGVLHTALPFVRKSGVHMHTADRFALESSTRYKTFDCSGYIILQYPHAGTVQGKLRSNNYKKMADKGPCGRGKLAFYRDIDSWLKTFLSVTSISIYSPPIADCRCGASCQCGDNCQGCPCVCKCADGGPCTCPPGECKCAKESSKSTTCACGKWSLSRSTAAV